MDKDHPISIEPVAGRVRVSANGRVVAESGNALRVREARLPPVYYLPRVDADMKLLEPTDHRTHCPYKGDASYFTIVAGDERRENAVWSYEQPIEGVRAIAGALAFYPDKVDAIEVLT